MYGLPDSAPLSQVVHELCRPHERTKGEHTGQEPALLAMLERAIGSDQGRGSVSGVSGASGVLNLSALQLWGEIGRTVGAFWPGRGDLAQADTHLILRLEQWTTALAGTADEIHLQEMAEYWHRQIRELLEPARRVPVRGGQCPRCKEHQVLGTNPDGERVYVPCLLAHLDEDPVKVECLGCGGTWYGNTPLAMLDLLMANN